MTSGEEKRLDEKGDGYFQAGQRRTCGRAGEREGLRRLDVALNTPSRQAKGAPADGRAEHHGRLDALAHPYMVDPPLEVVRFRREQRTLRCGAVCVQCVWVRCVWVGAVCGCGCNVCWWGCDGVSTPGCGRWVLHPDRPLGAAPAENREQGGG